MTQRGTVEVIDKGGWSRSFPLNKNIIHVGSDARNDIVIETWHGNGLAARHLQLVPSPTSSLGYRLVNMGTIEVLLGPNGERSLPPRAAIDLAAGDTVRLGDLTFIFHGEGAGAPAAATAAVVAPSTTTNRAAPVVGAGLATAAVAATRKGNPIGLNLTLSQALLVPGQPIDGAITIKNQGDKTGVQFKIEVEGFESDSYELGPAPILFPDVEKQVLFRLRHPQRPNPPAGDRRLTIRVTAPSAYPGEVATVSQVIQIASYIKHSLSLEFT
jgi:hypothetical protein